MKYINILISDGVMLQLIADVDVEVSEQDGVEAIHLSELVHAAVLQAAKQQDKALIRPGKYTVRLLATVVGEEDECSSTE